MNPLLPAAALILVAAITPGPNNLVVMHAAAQRGLRAALPPITGIVLGSLALYAVALAGGAKEPRVERSVVGHHRSAYSARLFPATDLVLLPG